jgi:uncharacterized damage-inducible protein DinB
MRGRAGSGRAAARERGFHTPLDFRFFFAYAFRRCHPNLASFFGGFMALNEALLPEFDAEMANTRKTLERVPTDKFSWKPHERSGTMGWLANHLADVPEWAVYTLQQESLDMAPNGVAPTPPPPPKTTKELLAKFDKNVAAARALLAKASDAEMHKTWSLMSNGATIIAMPRVACLRTWVMNHGIHHRAQLGVYLRLNSIAVPAIYGPSADEGAM